MVVKKDKEVRTMKKKIIEESLKTGVSIVKETLKDVETMVRDSARNLIEK